MEDESGDNKDDELAHIKRTWKWWR